MKQRIYLSLCLLLSIGLLTGCGDKEEPPTVSVTPTPVETPAVVPSPIASVSPTPELLPSATPSPEPSAIPDPLPSRKPILHIPAPPKSSYPPPSPVAILVPPEPLKPKPIKTEEPVSKIDKLDTPTDPDRQITPLGIGVAKIGMTFKDLKEQIGTGVEFPVKTSLVDGFDAIAVTKAGKVQYYIPYPTGTKFTDEDRIQHLMTDNPNYRTEQGVGPGTTIKQASAVYGGATLSLSKENESREFINFSQHPTGIAFRPKPAGKQSFAGDYPESNEEYLKTQKYDPKAAIGQITISCTDDNCGKEPPQAGNKEDNGTVNSEQ